MTIIWSMIAVKAFGVCAIVEKTTPHDSFFGDCYWINTYEIEYDIEVNCNAKILQILW